MAHRQDQANLSGKSVIEGLRQSGVPDRRKVEVMPELLAMRRCVALLQRCSVAASRTGNFFCSGSKLTVEATFDAPAAPQKWTFCCVAANRAVNGTVPRHRLCG
jgi:hypothetical protein